MQLSKKIKAHQTVVCVQLNAPSGSAVVAGVDRCISLHLYTDV